MSETINKQIQYGTKGTNNLYNVLYCTINLVNGKFYIGVHKTNNLNDEYIGSGSYLNRSIEKYGEDNFYRLDLEFYDNDIIIYEREEELVSDEFLINYKHDCYNLVKGGGIGWNKIHKSQI